MHINKSVALFGIVLAIAAASPLVALAKDGVDDNTPHHSGEGPGHK